MKLMIISDIHGSAYYCQLAMQAIETEKPDKVLILGDVLYHGPRNDLPRDYDPKKVAAMLNEKKDYIVGITGNCDADIDAVVLEYPISEDLIFFIGDRTVYASHGHRKNETNVPPHRKGDILLNGHTHVPACIEHEDYLYINPGSTSIPKQDSCHSYMMVNDGLLEWKDLEDGRIYMSKDLSK